MAVRYLANTYGNTAPIDIMKRMGTGATLPEAFVEIVGIQYSTFEERFTGWLQSWEDPKQSQVSRYTQSFNEIMSAKAAIGDLRSEDLASGAPAEERVATKKGLAADAKELSTQAGKLIPPPELQPLQNDGVRFIERFVTLFTLKLEHLVNQAYPVFLEDVISSVDSISKTRTADIRGGSAPSQRVTTKQGLVSDADALVQLLNDAPVIPSLKPIHSQELASGPVHSIPHTRTCAAGRRSLSEACVRYRQQHRRHFSPPVSIASERRVFISNNHHRRNSCIRRGVTAE